MLLVIIKSIPESTVVVVAVSLKLEQHLPIYILYIIYLLYSLII